MKKLLLMLAGALAFGNQAVALDCAPGKQSYSFKPTGKQFNIGMPPAKYSETFGKTECCFIKLGDVKGSAKAKVIRAEGSSYLKLGDIEQKDVKEGSKLYRAETSCKK